MLQKKIARHEALRKSWSTNFPLGGGGKPYLATGLFLKLNLFMFEKNKK